ncbi:MAG: NADH-quinone oxidoreductase subunit NuoE [Methanocorpusculum sp.]|nr:NADH-quinone oxidoreductase subunit NuoE [Methanocorpusculum sp.]
MLYQNKFSVTKMLPEEIDAIISVYPKEMEYALAILQDMQHKFGCVPREGMEAASAYLSCPVSHLYSMVTFYKALSLKPKGKHIIKVCDGTACHIKKSIDISEEICKELNIRPGDTTKDGVFSLELVNCLGTCALAPVMLVDNKYFGKVTKRKVKSILAKYRTEEKK